MDDKLTHYGTPRHSGRYPWGSGENPHQRNKNFIGTVNSLKKQGMSDVEIAKGLGVKTTDIRIKRSLVKAEQRRIDAAQALRLKDKGYSNVAIGKRMGKGESTIRSLLDPVLQERADRLRKTADMIKDGVDKKQFLDVGVGMERYLNISRTQYNTAIALLKQEGYTVHYIPIPQGSNTKFTTTKVLAPPGTTYTDVIKNKDKISMLVDYSKETGRSSLGLDPIKSIESNRIMVRYKEEGGADKDGVIELRRGVEDISLGNKKYAQVRIGVDDTHFLKGMAMYTDNIPNGVDIIFNTNKKIGTPLKSVNKDEEQVLKPMKKTLTGEIDSDNPFGSTIKEGGQRGVLNLVREEGDWFTWSKTLSSQMLSKQKTVLVKKQLDLTYNVKKEEFDEIMALTNPTVKKLLLESFAGKVDSAAVHLKAAGLPKQTTSVILPFPDMRETEIYAPNYETGDNVVLIRHPHGGIFEIPQLIVNNNHPGAKKVIGGAQDAVGINPKVAAQLSGADFDGDTVLVIPNSKGAISTAPPLKGLIGFDAKETYKHYEGMPRMSKALVEKKMGDISNLITDMTIRGATDDDLTSAIKHSMVVIDAEKHYLDYKRSYIENRIGSLKKSYQGKSNAGASTLISRAGSPKVVNFRKEKTNLKNMTPQEQADYLSGKKVYEYTGENYVNRIVKGSDGKDKRVYKDAKTGQAMFIDTINGKRVRVEVGDKRIKEVVKYKQTRTTKMADTDDAFELSSGMPVETVYATYANKMKDLAREARKEAISTPRLKYNPSANKTYAPEVSSLMAQLNIALKNAPLERSARRMANSVVATKRRDNLDMTPEELKKVERQALEEARTRYGAKKDPVSISTKEWEAIQAGAISDSSLRTILNNTNLEVVKQLATPRSTVSVSPAKIAKARNMMAAGHTRADIAASLGVSVSTVAKLLE